ncbi:hypothetical protein AMJ52_07050 [candidate division TA06 bacterium DG_78]|uniref:Uncharacterized protein n=1 Tax=candidate division TA06 bacterium DG_78 TaxID=1703772 RepID=A0A0S7YCQ5_UNCT6|nr:MAG: hypothetical protein AMJ52_07050 [candidate division TA06 bacterium DG_78]
MHIPLGFLKKLVLNIFLCCLNLDYNSRKVFNQKSIDDTHDYRAEKDKHFLTGYIKAIETHWETEYESEYDTVKPPGI